MHKQTVWITGSSRGIGLAIASKFARHHYNVVINCSRSVDQLEEAVRQLSLLNTPVMGVPADVSRYEEAAAAYDCICERFGGVDILVNNAGISHVGLFQDMHPEEWQQVIHTNLCSVMNVTHVCLPYMLRQQSGSIVNISSIWGLSGASCEAVYSASKGGVNAFTQSTAKELAPSGIRVNAVACGVIDTEMNQWLSDNEKTALRDQIPFMRFGRPDEAAELVYYLSRDTAGYLTGQIIPLDGGLL